MPSPADRVEAYLDLRAAMRGLDPESIIGADGIELTVSDLRELVATYRDVERAQEV